MAAKISTIGFDADDTLWQNEQFFQLTQTRFAELLRDYADPDHLADRLLDAERRNLGHYGFGVKGFTLSMIETAIEVTEDRVPARVIRALIEAGQEMLSHPIELLPNVEHIIRTLSQDHTLLLITKGDLLDQERKLAQSGLGDHFDGVQIVSDKTPQIYRNAFAAYGGAAQSVMVGNSIKSDVIPALEAGAWAVHVPHDLTWAYERAAPPVRHQRFHAIEDLTFLPAHLRRISQI